MLGRLAHLLLARERRTANQNLARVFPDLDAATRNQLRKRSYVHLGEDIGAAVFAMTRGFVPLEIEPEDICILQQCVDEGRGTLVVSAHLGPWEQVGASVVAAGFPLTSIARESYDPRLTATYGRLRQRHGIGWIYRGEPGAMARAMLHLQGGGLLGVIMDLKTRVPSVSSPFLGNPAPTAIGPARMALRSGARVVVLTAAPNGLGHLAVSVTPILTGDLSASAEGELELTNRLNEELSRRIRALPDRWLWMHPRFDEPPH